METVEEVIGHSDSMHRLKSIHTSYQRPALWKFVGLFLLLILTVTGCVLAGGSTSPAVSVENGGGKDLTGIASGAAPVEATAVPATPTVPAPTVTVLPSMTPSPAATAPPALVIARPQEIERGYIPNPGMGWQDSDRPRTRFPETVGYGRYNWSALNPAEGVYDWSPIETLRAQMRAVGGQFSFRVRTVQPEPWGPGLTAPQWMLDLGLQATGDPGEQEPVYSTCLFLEKHAVFIDELRKRYDGDSDVAYIDIGSYGFYGEWDSPQYDPTEGSLDWHTRRRIVDMYLGGEATRPCLAPDGTIQNISYAYTGFHATRLMAPYTPWGEDTTIYSVSRRPDVGIRHDSLGSEEHQNAYREQIGGLVNQVWQVAPIAFEFSYDAARPEALASARRFVQETHASYVRNNFGNERGDNAAIESVLEVLGYRLVLREMRWPAAAKPGERIIIEGVWTNAGSAPPYVTYPLVLYLTNTRGDVIAEYDAQGVNLRTWFPGVDTTTSQEVILPGGLQPGVYDVRVAFVHPVTRVSALNLAITGRDEQGRYLIGEIVVRNP